MAKSMKAIKAIAKRMVESDKPRDAEYQGYDQIADIEFELPKEMKEIQWVREVPSTDGYDAIEAGARVLTSTDPRVTYQPLRDNQETKDLANQHETSLLWQLKGANRRRPTKVEADMAKNALKYSSVNALVIDLEWQIKQAGAFGADTKRLEAAKRHGRFMVNTYNPKDVHVQRTGIMIERVLLCQERDAQEVMDEWGSKGTKLKKLAEAGKTVIYNDYMDYDVRAVWCATKNEGDGDGDITILSPEAHEMNFIPWVALEGGKPLLYGPSKSGQWMNKNIADTLNYSEVIAHAAFGRFKEEGPNPDTAEVNYKDSSRHIKVPTGNTLTPINPPQIDAAMTEWGDRMGAAMEKSTVSRIISGGDVPAGTAFASLNLLTQTAIGALKPAKRLAEQGLAEMFTIMVLWSIHTKIPLEAYGTDKRGDLGKDYIIDPDVIDETALYIEVELTPDEPTDKQQKANTATQLVQWGYSKESALEDMGVTNPGKEIERWYFEKLLDNEINLIMQESQLSLQQKFEQAAAQMAMAQQQAQAQAEAAQQQQMGSIPGAEGFNPAGGGQPAQMAAPGATFEGQTGMDRTGNEIAEGQV